MKYFICLLLCLLFTSCDPAYRIYVYNKTTSDIYLKTKPAIVSRYDDESSYRDSIIKHRVSLIDGVGVYRIKPNDSFMISGAIGGPTVEGMPFDWIELTSAKDTVILDSKEKIYKQIQRMKNPKRMGKAGRYYIEIVQ